MSLLTRILAAVAFAVGVVLSPFVLAQLITVDGSLETVPLIVSTILSLFLIVTSLAVFFGKRSWLLWILMLSIAPLFFAGLEAVMWIQFQLWAQDRNQTDLRAQEIMRNVAAQGDFPSLGDIALQRPHKSDLYTVNPDGFRTRDFSAKSPGEFRIAVLGGSTAFGILNADQNTIPEILERRLRQEFGQNISVWNMGVPGVISSEELTILNYAQDRIAPDLVIVYHGGNDFGRAYGPIRGREDESLVLRDTVQNRVYAFLEELGTVALIRLATSVLLAPDGPDPADPVIDSRITDAANRFNATMAAFDRFCSTHDILCRYYLQPIVQTREPRTLFEKKVVAERRWRFPDYGKLYRLYLDRIAAKPAVEHVDITDVLDGASGQQFLDVIHTTTRANETIADAIVRSLIQDPAVRARIAETD